MEQEGTLTPEMIDEMRERKQAWLSGKPEEGIKPDDDLTEEEQRERTQERIKFEEKILECENECYEYKLVGVTVHIGTADAGHYYSLINTERFKSGNEDDPKWLATETEKWMEFNDSTVKPYDFEELQSDTFGGDKTANNDFFGGILKASGFGKSGYVLVYEKVI